MTDNRQRSNGKQAAVGMASKRSSPVNKLSHSGTMGRHPVVKSRTSHQVCLVYSASFLSGASSFNAAMLWPPLAGNVIALLHVTLLAVHVQGTPL